MICSAYTAYLVPFVDFRIELGLLILSSAVSAYLMCIGFEFVVMLSYLIFNQLLGIQYFKIDHSIIILL